MGRVASRRVEELGGRRGVPIVNFGRNRSITFRIMKSFHRLRSKERKVEIRSELFLSGFAAMPRSGPIHFLRDVRAAGKKKRKAGSDLLAGHVGDAVVV